MAKKTKQTAAGKKQDSKLKAKHAGKRKSASGKTYYESRPNRSDANLKKKI